MVCWGIVADDVQGNFLTPMAMIGKAVFLEVARVSATMVTGQFFVGHVGVHLGRRYFSTASGGGRGF